jgi:hypothetical protein
LIAFIIFNSEVLKLRPADMPCAARIRLFAMFG